MALNSAVFEIVEKETNDEVLTIRDMGHHSINLTITNDAENVVARLLGVLNGRRLFYYDSSGIKDTELVYDKKGRFICFEPIIDDPFKKKK